MLGFVAFIGGVEHARVVSLGHYVRLDHLDPWGHFHGGKVIGGGFSLFLRKSAGVSGHGRCISLARIAGFSRAILEIVKLLQNVARRQAREPCVFRAALAVRQVAPAAGADPRVRVWRTAVLHYGGHLRMFLREPVEDIGAVAELLHVVSLIAASQVPWVVVVRRWHWRWRGRRGIGHGVSPWDGMLRRRGLALSQQVWR